AKAAGRGANVPVTAPDVSCDRRSRRQRGIAQVEVVELTDIVDGQSIDVVLHDPVEAGEEVRQKQPVHRRYRDVVEHPCDRAVVDLVARQPGDVDLVEERGEREHVIPGVLTTEHVQVQGTCSVVDQPRCDDTDLLDEIAVEREGHMYGFPFPRSSSGYRSE